MRNYIKLVTLSPSFLYMNTFLPTIILLSYFSMCKQKRLAACLKEHGSVDVVTADSLNNLGDKEKSVQR